ncbi:MAG TPA: FAD-dependent oxidoreductase [Polyangia bacterium]|jgi:NADPH-dependent 2,4-dienoyl-CoA reductase/sulfur reductase-like enzyme/nitrite reductase/ring-hydroxylating ferredoxin subunit|nr:FAD-dependent oxidoreductase [Polyangia bacterium]
MGGEQPDLSGPDFRSGVKLSEVPEGVATLGHADGEAVIVVRRGSQAFAVGATCSHYGGPLAKGLLDGDTVRCPLHHARFDLRTGEAIAAPAFQALPCWDVEQRGDALYVLSKRQPVSRAPAAAGNHPRRVVIVGGGAAGYAAAEMLRRDGYAGTLTMLSAEPSGPVDRPNLSKDYLAGTAPEEWMPLAPPEFFVEQKIDLITGSSASAIDTGRKTVSTEDGRTFPYDVLLLATGAEPVRLDVPGADLPHVFTLRSLSDSRAIIERSQQAKRAVIIGASFIGLEVAASLRARNIAVAVVAREALPLAAVMGNEIGAFVRTLHEQHGVVFHLENTVRSISAQSVTLADGAVLPADLVVTGIGVRPRTGLAEKAGLTLDRGVVVDEFLQTSVSGIFAAGDIARWPDPHSGQKLRVEHWVVAERQGQIAAKNILGGKITCSIVPFFWSHHYDLSISYVGHAQKWDRTDVSGDVSQRNCTVALRAGAATLAVITIGRGRQSLEAELAFERGDARALAALE